MPLADLFRRPHYASDATRFLDELRRSHPALDEQQQQGRARLWDRDIDRGLQAEFSAACVAQRPYVYQTAADD
ncbi:MAG: DUF3460 family protein [Burkholderiaceae bacterium]|jgi:hypothetical protein|nr:DUF3460 family protein [Burkholderiaceae bacterium]